MNMSVFTGTGRLFRLMLRKERVRLPIWIVSISVLFLLSILSFPETYPTPEDRQGRALLLESPALRAMAGPGYGLENYTFGAMITNEMFLYVGIAAAFMSIFMIVRNTRAEEESGLSELVKAGVIGRVSMSTAAFLLMVLANLFIAVIIIAGMPYTIEGLSWEGASAFGLGVAGVGIMFGTISLLMAQVSESAGAASGISSALLGLAFLFRAVGDVASVDVWRWLSPIGWGQAMRAFVDERWWPLGLFGGGIILLAVAAIYVDYRRDDGAGVLRVQSGKARAGGGLTHLLGLQSFLFRWVFLSWAAGAALYGVAMGAISEEAADFFADNPIGEDFLVQAEGATLAESLFATYMAFLAMLAAGYALQVMTKMLREEKSGRGEILLVQSVPRPRWMLDYLLISCVGSFMLLVISGIGAGALYGYYTDSADGAWKVFFAAIAQTPAVWVFIGLAALLMGLWPKALSLVWLVYTAFTLIGLIGPLLQLPEWVSDISPYAQIPDVPAEEWTAWSTVILLAVFAVFTVVGMYTIRKRDLII